MVKKDRFLWLLVLNALVLLGACSGGGGEEGLSNNACADLGLPAKIVNGVACGDLTRSPVVRIMITKARTTEFCTGAMITGSDVLTAGHCLLKHPRRVEIIYGDSLVESVAIAAAGFEVHPDFGTDPNNPALLVNDIAVIHLERPAPLPVLPLLRSGSVEAGDVVGIFGYGMDEKGLFTFNDLKSGQMRVASVTDTHIEADFDGAGSNTCLGDSGGPMTLSIGGRAVLVGVTSTGTEAQCQSGDQSQFSKVQAPGVADFIAGAAAGASYY
jgi:secreted trypsin-like serine protease